MKARRLAVAHDSGAVQPRLRIQKGQRLGEGIADAAVQHQRRIAAGAELILCGIPVAVFHFVIIRGRLRQGVVQQQRTGSLAVALPQDAHIGGGGLLQRRQRLLYLLRGLGVGPRHGTGSLVKMVVVVVRHRTEHRAYAVEGVAQIVARVAAVVTLRQRHRGLARQKGVHHQPGRRRQVAADLPLHQRRAPVIVQRESIGRFLRRLRQVWLL